VEGSKKYLIGCDWGTTSLRMVLWDFHREEIVARASRSIGIKIAFQRWQEAGQPLDRIAYYIQYLQPVIAEWEKIVNQKLGGTPLIVSGMASSSIGMRELSYAKLPFKLSGESLITDRIPASEPFPHPLILVSGIERPGDVMRGEEVQAMGLHPLAEAATYLAIFPGTHSKHIQVKANQIVNFSTFMTGELFALLANHSILANSIQLNNIGEFPGWETPFSRGVHAGQRVNLLHELFTLRARDLQQTQSPQEAGMYLSGLLIGYEVSGLSQRQELVYVCGNTALTPLYRIALQQTGVGDQLGFLAPEQAEELAFWGQRRVYAQHFQESHGSP